MCACTAGLGSSVCTHLGRADCFMLDSREEQEGAELGNNPAPSVSKKMIRGELGDT